jgi:beta-lactamase superfamily II metal-dependent hydrolase
MFKVIAGCALVAGTVTLFGCASTPPEVDSQPWTQEDEKAFSELEAAWKQAPPVAEETPEAAVALEAVPPPPPQAAGPLLEIHVFNIGQADSMLVIGPAPARKTLLIDLGEPTPDSHLPPGLSSSAEHVRQRIKTLTGRSQVDYFLLTHYHSDHAGFLSGNSRGTGIIGLLSDSSTAFSVGDFIHVGPTGAEFMPPESRRRVFKMVKAGMPIWTQFDRVGASVPPRFGTGQIDLGPGVSVEVLAFAGKVPSGGSAFDKAKKAGANYSKAPGDENDLSIALEISAGEFEMFTAGDLNGTDDPVRHSLFTPRHFSNGDSTFTNIEHHLVAGWMSQSPPRESDVEVYRADHHGSGFSTTQKLLDALDPEFILYSTGADHGHPDNTIVQRGGKTARQLATTAVTDPTTFHAEKGSEVGEIEILVLADGKSYTIQGKSHTAFSDAQEKDGDDVGEEDR